MQNFTKKTIMEITKKKDSDSFKKAISKNRANFKGPNVGKRGFGVDSMIRQNKIKESSGNRHTTIEKNHHRFFQCSKQGKVETILTGFIKALTTHSTVIRVNACGSEASNKKM